MNKKIFALILFSSYALAQDATFTRVQRGNRRFNAKTVRTTVAHERAQQNMFAQPTNGDEQRYADLRGSYGKGLKQLPTGFVDPTAFNILVRAFQLGTSDSFLTIPMGTNPVERKMHTPQAGLNFALVGADFWIHSIIAPPAMASAQKAGEMVEIYWMSLLRDISFLDYDSNPPLVAAAIADLNKLSDFRGPKVNGAVTPQTLFRANLPGVLTGPFISQLLLKDVPFFDTNMAQRYTVPTAVLANSFMTTFDEWFFIQQGHNPLRSIALDGTTRYMRNARDLGNFVHVDPPQLPYIFALLILLKLGPDAWDKNNPYLNNSTQEAFVEFFKPQYATMVTLAGEMGLRAAWYQKWAVHRTIRPEFYAFLVNQQITGQFNAGLNQDVINSDAVDQIFAYNATLATNAGLGTYFVPQAFPEGSPIHPTYPAGHATVAGACVTVLKAFFDEEYVIPNPVVPDAAGTALVAYVGDPLTIGGELNKFGYNVAVGRNMAGVHYRSDAEESMRLGETVAIALLEDFSYTYNINFKGFHLTKFDGTKILIGGKKSFNKVNG